MFSRHRLPGPPLAVGIVHYKGIKLVLSSHKLDNAGSIFIWLEFQISSYFKIWYLIIYNIFIIWKLKWNNLEKKLTKNKILWNHTTLVQFHFKQSLMLKTNFVYFFFTLKSYQILLSCFLLFRIYFYLLLNIIMKI